MIILVFISNIATLLAASDQESGGFFKVGAGVRNHHALTGLSNTREAFSKPLSYNSTYIDKEENLLRVPNKYYDEQKSKKKIKKPPNRTVQKIIKKNKLKSRKIYLYPATLIPTLASKAEHRVDDVYTRQSISTTEYNFKRKSRKNTKYIRYPMPFQKLQRKDGIRSRSRREDRDVYILKDLDEIKFLSNEKEYDKVLAHVQKHW